MTYTQEQKQSIVDAYGAWWHSIDMGDGVTSSGMKSVDTHNVEKQWFPTDFFIDKRVLDIGTWDGYYAFYAERMGAKEVVAVDHFVWNIKHNTGDMNGKVISKKGFDIAKELLNSNVKEYDVDIEDMDSTTLGTFDSIIYAGVFYHLKNPYKALEVVDKLLNINGRIMIESHMCNYDTETPLLQFHPKNSLNNDTTNFWSPNPSCIEAMFQEIGNYTVEKNMIGSRGVMVLRKN